MDAYSRFNEWLALAITRGVSTMTCAYLFAGLACLSLPNAVGGGVATFVPWLAQTFLQLVLLSIIMVGQGIQQRRMDELHDKHDAEAEKAEKRHQAHAALLNAARPGVPDWPPIFADQTLDVTD